MLILPAVHSLLSLSASRVELLRPFTFQPTPSLPILLFFVVVVVVVVEEPVCIDLESVLDASAFLLVRP